MSSDLGREAIRDNILPLWNTINDKRQINITKSGLAAATYIKDPELSLSKEEKRLYCLHSFVGVSAEEFLSVAVDKNKRKNRG